VLTVVAPRRPWLWALAIGIWIPAETIMRQHSLGSLMMLLVLAFPFGGAYAGVAVRRVLSPVRIGGRGREIIKATK
jgi:hypothetical protein